MNVAESLPKFFVFLGAILVVTGIAQALVRPRKPNESMREKVVNAATVKAVLFVTVGVLGVLVGLGVVPMAGPPR